MADAYRRPLHVKKTVRAKRVGGKRSGEPLLSYDRYRVRLSG